jgi:hypothetical protein
MPTMAPVSATQSSQRSAQLRELVVAADERREHAPIAADAGAVQPLLLREQLEHAKGGVASLLRGRFHLAVLEDFARRAIDLDPDVDVAGGREVLELVGDAHGIAHDGELPNERPADVPRDPEAGVDAAVDVERQLGADRFVVGAYAATHLDRGVHGGARRVLDRFVHAEERHDAVTEILLDGSAVLARDLVEQSQASDDDGVGALGSRRAR